eukprot:TRINITY_DN20481_c0_g1_i1.p4 TRINITY_DN20481_c0_g1~~TRINITY_DN20481_c0_g1_i1.p4  ORF type:complete len:103 (+),score=7.73 TRINITY_DN20481_c0_g1_i1:94-402(+)
MKLISVKKITKPLDQKRDKIIAILSRILQNNGYIKNNNNNIPSKGVRSSEPVGTLYRKQTFITEVLGYFAEAGSTSNNRIRPLGRARNFNSSKKVLGKYMVC